MADEIEHDLTPVALLSGRGFCPSLGVNVGGIIMRNSISVRRGAIAACLAAISYVLMYFSFVIIPIVPFMKLDFSDIPILLGLFILGPWAGLEIAAIRSIIYFVLTGVSLPHMIGVGLSFVATIVFCYPLYFMMRDKNFTLKNAVLAIAASMISLTVVLSLTNFFVTIPLYMNLLGMKLGMPLSKMVLFGVVPFNLIKGAIIGGLFALVYCRLESWVSVQAHKFV